MAPRKPRQSLADRVEPAKVLYYGPPGTGKTTCLASLALLGDLKYVEADKSVRARALRRLEIPVERIEPITELDPTTLDTEYCWAWAEKLESGEQFSIAVDTATELVARRIEAQVDAAWAETLETAKAVGAELSADEKKKRYFVNRDYYGVETQEMRRLLRHLRDLPCHVAWSAQMRRDVDEDTGKVMYGPDVNPAIQGDLMGYANQVIELSVDGEFHLGHTRPRPNRHGKDRDGYLPSILVSPTMDRVVGYLEGNIVKETDPIQAAYREVVAKRKERAAARS